MATPDSCTGIESFIGETEEDNGDPVAAIARRYLAIPCACMPPNSRRLTALSQLIDRFHPDAVVDFVLTACYSYNVESHKIGRHVSERHSLPYLKIESNYSKSDEEQIRTKFEALFELARS